MKATIWRVNLGDQNYARSISFVLQGKDAATVEAKAIKLAKEADKDLVSGEKKHAPYVQSIELVGDLNG